MSKGIVIADYHHPGLFQSLMFLFEKRLGYELYRPFGKEWVSYLLPSPISRDPEIGNDVHRHIIRLLETPSFLTATDPDKIRTLSVPMGRMITLKEAMERKEEIRFVIASQHDTQYHLARFVQDICPHAKLIRQCGNPNEHVTTTKNVLSSDLLTYNHFFYSDYHKILYHQEFHSVYYFAPFPGYNYGRVHQYINWAHQDERNREFYLWFKALCEPIGIKCYEHGQGGEDGEFDYHIDLARSIRRSQFVLSHKWWDGYGMLVHNAYACGRPVICFEEDYRDKLAGELMTDMETAVFISSDEGETQNKIQEASEKVEEMQRNSYKRFKEMVDFDKEEKRIRGWLKELL